MEAIVGLIVWCVVARFGWWVFFDDERWRRL